MYLLAIKNLITQVVVMSAFPFLIAVSGKLGTGKDYVTNNILVPLLQNMNSKLKYCKMALADQIKINLVSRAQAMGKTEPTIEQCLSGHKSSNLRKLLQQEGTEHGRDIYGESIWINTIENTIRVRQFRGDNLDVVIITDARFPDEVRWIERKGGIVIRLNAPKRNNERLIHESGGDPEIMNAIANHSSETALDSYPFFKIFDNDPDAPYLYEPIRNTLFDKLVSR
jgi:hypothetical protein